MENSFNKPAEVVEGNINVAVTKAGLSLGKMILMGIMAGAFIAFGGAASSTAVHGVSDVGLARLLAGCVFPVGLMMVVIVGGELFTGNSLMIMGALDGKITWGKLIRNFIVVYLSNLVGALIIDVLLFYSGNLDYSGGLMGAYTIKVAVGKASIDPIKGIVSGILCNILVCLTILMAGAAKDISGKIWAIFFPICAFVIAGFEHCVANMFYIPAGILAAANPDYVAVAQETYGITTLQLESLNVMGLLKNLLPVTAGNLIGGMLFVGLPCYLIHKRNWDSNTQKCKS